MNLNQVQYQQFVLYQLYHYILIYCAHVFLTNKQAVDCVWLDVQLWRFYLISFVKAVSDRDICSLSDVASQISLIINAGLTSSNARVVACC